MKSKDIINTFLNFFEKKNHKIINSSKIISIDDPSLMFVNSGMNAFKNIFIGNQKPIYKKIANVQKCLRISGKHNDLNEVGYDHHHHTMFEMLGNWSFGDYFKKEAIELAWDLLTNIYNIKEENLYVTIFIGDKEDNLSKDIETYNIWKNIIKNSNNIIFFGKKNNFWEMGIDGPCGPCSEIHIDLRTKQEKENIPGYKLINTNHPDVIEIWNIVFIEYLRNINGTLSLLPIKHIDTGMGLERLCRILQNKKSNYDTDLFSPIITDIENLTNKKYGNQQKLDIAFRVIVDHIRSIIFALLDGIIISNNGPGYVIKKILRRAITYIYIFFKKKQPFLYKLLPSVIFTMQNRFPEIEKNKTYIENIIKNEELKFIKTISKGINHINMLIKKLHQKNITYIPGKELFKLYDTYGLPLDISTIIANNKKLLIDNNGFTKAMLKQKEKSKSINNIKKYNWIFIDHKDSKIKCDLIQSKFIGYTTLNSKIKILKYRKIKFLEKIYYELVFDQTPFYPEGGGQLGDIGYIESESESIKNEKIDIINTKKENNIIYHIVQNIPIILNVKFNAFVNILRRKKIEKNHTAIHLLSLAIRKIINNNIQQMGSYIGPDKIRFDFYYNKKITENEIINIENYVNNMIFQNIKIEVKELLFKDALKSDVIFIPNKNYKTYVRAIRFNDSFELCAGTHVKNTINIQYFKILSEKSIASGVRRIEAITSQEAINYINNIYQKYNFLLKTIKSNNILDYINKLKEKNKKLKNSINKSK